MRRALCIMLVVIMIFSLVACGGILDHISSDNSRTTGMSDATRELFDSINADNAEAMGFCGEDITWYYLNNVLVLKGTGRMTDFNAGEKIIRPYENVLPLVNSVIIDDGITYVSKFAFSYGVEIYSVYLPNTLEEIGDLAFKSCTRLTNINIPNSVTSIDSVAFQECTGLVSITLPNNIAYIGDSAFNLCTGLTSINIPDSMNYIGFLTFSGCTSLANITIPDSINSIHTFAFDNCTRLTSITFEGDYPDGDASINEWGIPDGATIYYHSGTFDKIIPEHPEFNWVKQ